MLKDIYIYNISAISYFLKNRNCMVLDQISLNFCLFFMLLPNLMVTEVSHGVVVEWNNLPLKLRQLPCIDTFKSRLKTNLFEMYYW